MNKEKLTMNVLFSGIGCQERGIENSNLFDIEVINTSEINKDAILSYAAVHCGLTQDMIDIYNDYPSREEMANYLSEINLGYEPEKDKHYDWHKLARRKTNDIEKYWLASKLTRNLGDISKIESLSYADMWTCSFPCTDISVAGKMKGLSPDVSTRSSLLWENIRLLKKAKEDGILPKYLMFENVKNLVSKKFIDDFNNLLEVLNELGFNSYWKVLNAKNCGVPQNRERVFVISIRKDIDKEIYDFPKPFDTGIRLKDVLDNKVDDKYYLSETMIKGFKRHNQNHEAKQAASMHTKQRLEPNISGATNTITTVQKDNYVCEPAIVEDFYKSRDERFYTESSPTLRADRSGLKVAEPTFRIRKLTPQECWKLMGLTETDCTNARNIGVADSQLYKQAGNGIVSNCVKLLVEHLYKAQYDNTYICSDEKYSEE